MKGRIISDNKTIIKPTPKPKKGKYDKLVGEIKSAKIVQTAEEKIPEEMKTKEDEKKELKLLEYQIKNKDMTVNQFLLNKYTEGNFNEVTRDGYDNSKKRIEAGIEYEYHVYFPYDTENDSKRPPNFLISTDEIVDFHTNDSYYYHFAVFDIDDKMYKLDYTGETINKNGTTVVGDKGLFSALQVLADHVKNDNPRFNDEEYKQLQQDGFISSDGKLKLDVPGLLVSKYFKGFKNEKKNIGMDYLNNVGPKDVDSTTSKKEKKEKKESQYSLVKDKTFANDGADLSDEEKLIAYCQANNISVKVIDQYESATKKTTGRIPFFLTKDDTLYLLFIRLTTGDRSMKIESLINTADVVIRAQYNQLKSGYFKNANDVNKLGEFFKRKSYNKFIDNYERGKISGFKERDL